MTSPVPPAQNEPTQDPISQRYRSGYEAARASWADLTLDQLARIRARLAGDAEVAVLADAHRAGQSTALSELIGERQPAAGEAVSGG